MAGAASERLILDRLDRIEAGMTRLGARFEARHATDAALGVLADGLAAYRRRVLEEAHATAAAVAQRRVLDRLCRDEALGFPHRKIVEALVRQYDPLNGTFRELAFSRLVRAARVGKSRTKGYLSLLERREYVVRRPDGYRTWFRIRPPAAQ